MSLPNIILPKRLEKALDTLSYLQSQQLYFAPIRHHSPACAYAVLSLIEEIKPTHILIEAPVSFNHLIRDLLSNETKPPIAIMGQAEICTQINDKAEQMSTDVITRSAFFPFCDYSPEWVALRSGHFQQAKLKFIDLPWIEQIANDQLTQESSQDLQNERYLAHSQFISQLAKKCYCRDHDDLWEHLFELRTIDELADWRQLFSDSFLWCALARLDYEPQVLTAEGSSQREDFMLASIIETKTSDPEAKILIVTGGFHTLALIEGLSVDNSSLNKLTPTAKKYYQKHLKQAEKDQSWLIRYSFDRLDALNGYASGMPAPAYYQRSWQTLMTQHHDKLAGNHHSKLSTQDYRNKMGIRFLSDVAIMVREKAFDNPPSYISVKNAVEQCLQLTALRGHNGPGRYDLLDGLQSSFIKGSIDDTQNELWLEIKKTFSGHTLGQIPKDSATPPLVSETYQLAKHHRFKLDDTLIKVSRLDVYRKPSHRARSRFLHLLSFLEINFASKLNGPDFLSGHNLDLLFEEWEYAWTPAVEGRLIALSEKGSQLEAIAMDKLFYLEKQLTQQGKDRSSKNAVKILIQAALIGLQSRFTALFNLLDEYVQADFRLSSLVECGHHLLHLWRGRDFLGLQDKPQLKQLLQKIIPQALFCLQQITQGDEQQQEEHLTALLSLRELIEFIPSINTEGGINNTARADFYLQLQRLNDELQNVPLLKGAVDALRFIGNEIEESTLYESLTGVFSYGSEPEQAIRYFIGLMRTAPELIVKTPVLVDKLHTLISQWDAERFLQILPDLRFAFSQLTPKQNANLAHYIAGECDIAEQEIALWQSEFSEREMLQTAQLNHKLQQQLMQDGLLSWYEHKKENDR